MSGTPCPGRLELCGVPCGCEGRNRTHYPPGTEIRAAASGPQRDHEARAREVLLPEVFAAERDRFIGRRDHGGEGGQ